MIIKKNLKLTAFGELNNMIGKIHNYNEESADADNRQIRWGTGTQVLGTVNILRNCTICSGTVNHV